MRRATSRVRAPQSSRPSLDLDVARRPLDGLSQRGAAARIEVEAPNQPGEHRAAQHLLLDGFESGLGPLTGDGGFHERLGHLLSVYEERGGGAVIKNRQDKTVLNG